VIIDGVNASPASLAEGRIAFFNVQSVASIMVGIDRKNENSSAAARDIPASWPAAIVLIDRLVPGNTADKIWHAPIQIACQRVISSMNSVRYIRTGMLVIVPAPPLADLRFPCCASAVVSASKPLAIGLGLPKIASTIHITIPPMR